jgi:hypothetical protein
MLTSERDRWDVEIRRRYADYIGDGPGPGSHDRKPSQEGPFPSRAWFERADDGSRGSWGMTVEHEMEYATNHQGEFRDLVEVAKRSGVTEYYVWSVKDADFLLYSYEDVIESPQS